MTADRKYYPAALPDMVQHLLHAKADPRVRAAICFDNHLDVDTLHQAVLHTLQVHPVLQCAFCETAWRARWVYDPEAASHAFATRKVSKARVHTAVNDLLCESLPLNSAPQIRVTLLRAPEHDMLVVNLNHRVTDIGGLKQYLALLSSVYNELRAGQSPALMVAEGDRTYRTLFRVLPLRVWPRVIKAHFKNESKPEQPCAIWKSGAAEPPRVCTYTVKATVVNAARKRAKCQQASLNDLVVAIYATVLRRQSECPSRELSVYLPVDMRRYAPVLLSHTLRNCTSGFMVRVPEGSASIADVTAQVARQTTAHKQSGIMGLKEIWPVGVIAPLLPYAWFKKLFASLSLGDVSLVTNFGSVEEDSVQFAGTTVRDVVLFGQILCPPVFWLSFSSYCGALTFSLMFRGGPSEQKAARDFLNQFGSEFASYAGGVTMS